MTRSFSPLAIFPFLLVFYEIATYLSNDMYLAALPQMMADLRFSTQEVQLTLTMWFMGAASMPLFLGAISDRYGRRPILLLGGIVYILSTVVCAITSNFSILLIARFIEGGMVPAMMIPGYACVHESYNQKQAVRLLALMGSISILAPAFGPLLGALILHVSNWRGIFWVIAIWASIAIALLYRWMPETLSVEKRHSLQFSLLIKNYRQILMNKRFLLLMLVLGFNFGGFIAWITAGPLLVMESFHYSAFSFGVIQAVVFIAYMVGNHNVKHLMEKLDIHKLIQLGLSITFAGGLLIFFLTALYPSSLFAFVFGMIIYSFGSALCFSPLNRAIIEASTEPMGARMAIFSISLSLFGVLGSGIASVIFNGSPASLGYIVSAAIAIAWFLNWLLGKLSN